MADKEEKKQPVQKFRAGGVTATIWANVNVGKDDKEYMQHSINFERSYQDKEGEFQKTNSYNVNDLQKLAVVLAKAQEYVLLNEEKERKRKT